MGIRGILQELTNLRMNAAVLSLDGLILRKSRRNKVIAGRARLILFDSAHLCATYDGQAVVDGANKIALWTWQSV